MRDIVTCRLWRGWTMRTGCAAILALWVLATAALPVQHRALADTTGVFIQWLRVDPYHPRTLFLGGRFTCTDNQSEGQCPPWVLRSADGGQHWTDLRGPLAAGLGLGDPLFNAGWRAYTLFPPVIAPDGRHIYLAESQNGSPATEAEYMLWSNDGGNSWHRPSIDLQQLPCGGSGGGAGFTAVVLSPVTPLRLYAVSDTGYNGQSCIIYSDDGQTFKGNGDPSSVVNPVQQWLYRPWGGLVADPRRTDTVYANETDVLRYNWPPPSTPPYAFVARSDDAGMSWSTVMTPTAAPPLRIFYVGTDRHEGALLVGYPGGPKVPADRLYLSADEGRTWRAATCPGDVAGTCPGASLDGVFGQRGATFTVDNVFGIGASYAFVRNGIYRFHGGGPAVARLGLSAALPFATGALIDLGAGRRAGDPVYALVRSPSGLPPNLLYSSTDGGHRWQRLLSGAFPLTAPPCRAETCNLAGSN